MKDTKFMSYLVNVKASENFDILPTFLRLRVEDAIKQLNSPAFIDRSISSPTYLNDLGVRKSKSPAMGYEILKSICSFGDFSFQDLLSDLCTIEVNSIGSFLDAYVLITGNYHFAYEGLKKSDVSFDKITDYTTLINIGSAFAAELDFKALDFFKEAGAVTESIENKVVALHRQAAYLIKRSNDKTKSVEKLRELVQQISEIPEGWRRQIYMALADNLYALLIVKSGMSEVNVTTIIYFLMNAETLVDSLPEFENYSDTDALVQQAQRYRSQIEMNYAQILIDNHQLEKAIDVLSRNLDHVSMTAKDYLCEAFATLGYAYYLNKDFTASISNLQDALGEYNRQGALHEAEEAKKILIAATFKSGDVTSAGDLFKTLTK